MSAKQFAVVVSGFPRLSETFATNELLALAKRRALAAIFATKPGDDSVLQPGNKILEKFTVRLPDGSEREQSEFLANTLRKRTVTAIHSYFAHRPATVAELGAGQLGIPFGFSVHARDARKVCPRELRERSQRAACIIACNEDAAAEIGFTGARVQLVPHGVDLSRFTHLPPIVTQELRILAVGRLVEKKGFQFLIDAVSRLKFPFQLRIVGDGPEEECLAQMIVNKRVMDKVSILRPQSHDELPQEFHRAHVVVVPSIVDASGDRDGLPNVVLEAMASGRPVIGSDVGAISAVVRTDKTGILIPPRDVTALAAALTKMATEPSLREHLGRNARDLVERDYELGKCSDRFYHVLENAYA